ncbi:MAG: hypothetical protein V3S16_15975 [Candidatus Desulfatibia sp.]|uniref:hypothetical protein n=1 Tax=Candidatus Desulfatibia sp. TaxID=3101189 RepID=UPI002F34DC23
MGILGLERKANRIPVKKSSTVAMIFLCLTLAILSGCATTPQVPAAQLMAEWNSRLPDGFKAQLGVARRAAEAYHAIVDTPIKQLQTESGAQQAGDLVTAARDKYRQWQSYGNYHVALPDRSLWYSIHRAGSSGYTHGFRARFGSITYDSGTPGNKGSVLEAVMNLGNSGSLPPNAGVIASSRGKVIFLGRHRDERNWQTMQPFKDIMEGDRIADIPALIGRIKR